MSASEQPQPRSCMDTGEQECSTCCITLESLHDDLVHIANSGSPEVQRVASLLLDEINK